MTFLTQRDTVFICRTATRKKWLKSKDENEMYSRTEYLDFVKNFDKYWNESEKEKILTQI